MYSRILPILLALTIAPAVAQTIPPLVLRSFKRLRLLEATAKDSASASIGDLNGDGFLDIVLARGRHTNLYNQIHLNNNGTGNFTVSNLGDAPDQTYSVAIGDMNHDGRLDIVVSNDMPENKTVYRNEDGVRFSTMTQYGDPAWNTRYVTLVDLNKDGFTDIVVANRQMKSYVCWNNGTGAFPKCTSLATISSTVIVAADFDGDGAIDLFVPHRDGSSSVVLWNDGKGGFATSTKPFGTSAAYIRAAAGGDLNGDGRVDIVVGSVSGGIKYYLNNGKRTFSKPISLSTTKSAVYSILIADMNRDGKHDVVVGYELALGSVFYRTSSTNTFREVRWNDGKGTVYGIAVGDLDGDGWPDIVAARSDAPNALWFSTP